jgi:dTDP-4-dehydrorhamnose 3,5-epimerase
MVVPSTAFSLEETAIPGLLLIDIDLIDDGRGWFQEKFRLDKLIDLGFPKDFRVVQNNISYNKEIGATRGIHAEPWNKYISVVSGEVFCAYVDLRDGPSFGKVVTTIITPENAVFLPKGCGNAFQTTKEDTYYSYLVDDYWTQEKYSKYVFLNLGDETLNIAWPTPLENAVISERDRQHPMLKDIRPMGL